MTTTLTMMTTMVMMVMVMVMMTGSVVGQLRTNVCSQVADDTAHASQRPRIPDQFRVKVECNMGESHGTIYVHEYYDLKRNRGRLTVVKPTGTKYYYMDYDQSVVMDVDPQMNTCRTGLLMLTPDRFVFGFRLEGTTSRMMSPSGALHFSNANESYVGQTTVRGIPVDQWTSCQYIDALQATANVTWSFSQRDAWNMQLGKGAAPIRMVVVGEMVLPNNTILPFNHRYDFFDFEPQVRATDFEVPNGVACPGRSIVSTPKPFPDVPSKVYFVGEIIDPYNSKYSIMEEAYDNSTKFAAYRFKSDESHFTGMNRFLELNDYNTGVSYLIDNSEGSCTWSSIKDSAVAFSKPINNKQVRMKTPREFFMDSSVQYQYSGSVTVRNIPAERWVGITNQAPGFVGRNATVEWYFAAEDHYSWTTGTASTSNNYRIPILFRLFLPGALTIPSDEFHIYNFNVVSPPFSFVDTSACFKGSMRRTLRFSFPKSQEATVRANIVLTKNAIQNAISIYTAVSINRVTNIRFYFNPDSVQVVFDLLDRPPDFGDVVKPLVAQNNLQGALQMLNDSFKDNMFSVSFAVGITPITVKPDFNSLEDISDQIYQPIPFLSDDSGYSAGAFAGLGVGMLILGGAGGSGGAFFFFK